MAIENSLIFYPKKFHIDFEIAVIEALKIVFPHSEIEGCLFHFSQCIWRKIQKYGLVKDFNENKEIRTIIKQVTALPFLPLGNITDAWLKIFEKVDPENAKLTKFMDYACRTWVNEDGKFDRKMWNHFQNYKIRTTNSVEYWHSKLQKASSKRHLNIYEFILLLKNQQLIFENEIAFLDVGHTPTAKRPKYKQIDEKIERD